MVPNSEGATALQISEEVQDKRKIPRIEIYDPRLRRDCEEGRSDKQPILDQVGERVALWSGKVFGPFPRLKSKLLVLDLNGLLVDVVYPKPKDVEADRCIHGRAIFRRPFYLEFLQFCLQNFEIGIWSSRNRLLIEKILEYLMGDLKNRLLFVWDSSYCSITRSKCLDNKHKNVVFKDLRKLWMKHDPQLPWEDGYFNESNTLLIDDSPYKALLNPPCTAIFPNEFKFTSQEENSLGIDGDIRIYLQKLADAKDVRKFVEENPFGKQPITENNEHWSFYQGAIESLYVPSVL